MNEENVFEAVMDKKDKTRIYLAGAGDELAYREYAESRYCEFYDLVNPMTSEKHKMLALQDPNREMPIEERGQILVPDDKELIKSCKYTFAFMKRYTAGTCMEILFSYENGNPVIIIDPFGPKPSYRRSS